MAWRDKAVEVCLEGLAGVCVLLNSAAVFWCPVKVEVLRAVGEPGFVSAQI